MKGNEPAIVVGFRNVRHIEHERLAIALSSVSAVPTTESKLQPVLLAEEIRISVTSFAEDPAVEGTLFELGCGFHYGGYPLSKTLLDDYKLAGIFVSRKGVVTITPLAAWRRTRQRDLSTSSQPRATSAGVF